MKRSLLGLALVATALGWPALQAQEPPPPPPAEPGYTYVCTTEYKEVTRYVCKLVPYVKKTKKWVYTTKDAPFCIHKDRAHLFSHCPDPCCLGPFDRKFLVKKEIVVKEEQTTRCVTEKVTNRVPCTVWRRVPLGAAGVLCPPRDAIRPKQ